MFKCLNNDKNYINYNYINNNDKCVYIDISTKFANHKMI